MAMGHKVMGFSWASPNREVDHIGQSRGSPANKAFVDALGAAEVKARMATLMAEPAPMTPDQFGSFVRAELQKYQAVVKASGAKAD